MSTNRYPLPAQPAQPARPADRPSARLLYISAARYSAEWNCTLHTHACAEIFFITGGHGYFHVQGKTFPVAVNDLVVVNDNVSHTETSQTDYPLEYIVLGVEGLEALAEIGGYTMLHLYSGREDLLACLHIMLWEAQERQAGCDVICQDLLEVVLTRLMRRSDFSLSSVPAGYKSSRECDIVRRYIDNHFKENLSLDQLAELAHINKYYLAHAFRREFGAPPISYLISRRIQESRYLLTDTDHTLSQIAHILGFSSLSYFSQSFRRLEGVSPMEYRRQHRPQGAGAP